MSKRIFIAIPVSNEIRKQAVKIRQKHKNLDVRWLFGHNLHITLIAPWEEDNIQKVENALENISNRIGPFDIEFHKVTFGPNNRTPRLIWAEGPVPEKLTKLKKKLKEILKKEKILETYEKRSFRLHMTIARFKPGKFKTFPTKKIDEKINWKQKTDKVALMQSHLTNTHAEYKTLREFNI